MKSMSEEMSKKVPCLNANTVNANLYSLIDSLTTFK